jgi:hypothetical protein
MLPPAPASTATPATTTTTATDSNKEPEVRRIEEDEVSEQEAEQRQADAAEQETQSEVRDPAPPTDCTMVNSVPHMPVRFDWAADVMGLGPVTSAPTQPDGAPPQPTVTPFNADMEPRARTPTMRALTDCTPAAYMPTAPAPVQPGNPITPPQPAPRPHARDLPSNQRGHVTVLKQRALPEPAVTPLDGDVAPRAHTPTVTSPSNGVTPSTRTPATGAPTDSTPAAHTPNAPALINPDLVDAAADPVRVAPGNPNLAPVRFAHANTIPVAPVASCCEYTDIFPFFLFYYL